MEPLSVFVIGFCAGCLTGLALWLWREHRRLNSGKESNWQLPRSVTARHYRD